MRVLFGTDGSTFARLAEEMIAHVADPSSSVTVVMAVPAPNLMITGLEPVGGYMAAEQTTNAWAQAKEAAQGVVDAAASRLSDKGFETEALVLEGDPAPTVRDFAADMGFDLVAVGSHGETGLMSLILGSVAKHLVHNAPCSVLVARTDGSPEAAAERARTLDRLSVLLAYDGTEGADVAKGAVAGLAKGCRSVLVVVAEPIAVLPVGIDAEAYSRSVEYDQDRAEQLAGGVAQELAQSCDNVTWATDLGNADDVVVEQAKKNGIDLIVIGASRHGAIERFLLGSVSSSIVGSAPCPVLVVRP